MPTPQRSKSKTNPEFDPNELADLIHTPAVGRGVAAHLLGRPESNMTTVDMSTVASSDQTTVVMWVSEEGAYVPQKKVQPIRMAQDALSPAELGVYELLWGLELGGSGALSKPAKAGYHLIMMRTGLSKKTVQRIIDKLTDKGFIEIDTPADIYRRTPTIYRVYGYGAVLERQSRRGRFHVAKIGPGVVYVRQSGAASSSRTT